MSDTLELAARYSGYNPDLDAGDNLQSEIMGGFNVFFKKLGHSLKLTNDVAFLNDKAESDTYNARIRTQVQAVF